MVKGIDFIDLTDLEKRGIIKFKNLKETEEQSADFVDLSQQMNSSSSSLNSNSSTTDSSPFGFLDALANSAEPLPPKIDNPVEESRQTRSMEVQHLQTKLEDLEYKLERFMERIEQLEDKLKETSS